MISPSAAFIPSWCGYSSGISGNCFVQMLWAYRGRGCGFLAIQSKCPVVPLVIRFCPNVSTLEIPYCPYPRVSHYVTQMTRLHQTISTGNRPPGSVPSRRWSSTSSMVTWPLACACAAANAAAEFSARLSRLPTATAIPPAMVTAGCASIVPRAHAVTPGNKIMPPTVVSTVETVDSTFGCFAIKWSTALCNVSGASVTVVVAVSHWHVIVM